MHWAPTTCRTCGAIPPECGQSILDPLLQEKLTKCLEIQVFKEDYKPKTICATCASKLDDFYKFRTDCHATDRKFDSILMDNDWVNSDHIIDYTFQSDRNAQGEKMSVIVNNTNVCQDMNLYKPLHDNVLDIVEEMEEYEDYYGLKKFNYNNTYQSPTEMTVLRRHTSSSYPQDLAVNYSSCQEQQSTICATNNDMTNFPNEVQIVPTHFNTPSASTVKVFQCPHCDKKFKRRLSLNSHIVTHTKVRPFVCDLCQKAYGTRTDLTNHKKVHTDLHQCHICDIRFPVPSKLQRHLRTHTNEKPYSCEHEGCGRSFSDKRNLDSHKLLHSNEFHFKCTECGKCYKSKSQLKQHQKSHYVTRAQFVCQVCSKSYKYKSNLVFHLKKHNGYICSWCDKNCFKRVALVKHKRVCAVKPTR